jgi:hypothetical protein
MIVDMHPRLIEDEVVHQPDLRITVVMVRPEITNVRTVEWDSSALQT